MQSDQQRPQILVLGTCDTKLAETLFLREQIVQNGACRVLLLDIGSTPVQHRDIDVSCADLAAADANADASLSELPRAEYIKHTIARATAYVRDLYVRGQMHGIVAAGGSSGTALATAVMRDALPVGFPKLMVSTMASGNVKPFVEETDITLMYSVVDIAGANTILGQILANAAGAIVGATLAYYSRLNTSQNKNLDAKGKKRVGITMFGVTTPCVDAIRAHLEEKHAHEYEVYVFHATGAGGKAMERLVRERQLDAVLDMTTTEIADELVGGVLSAGPDRLTAAAKAGIPQVISVGACDMVNFGPRETVPATFGNRRLHEHNPAVTLMRTSPEECTRIADFIASKLRAHASRPDLIRVLLPTGGISMISTPGQPFHDPEADSALFVGLEKQLEGSGIEVRRDDRAINDAEFAVLAAESLIELIRRSEANTV
ncbi:hypothetical protein VTN96DRAFT_7402 [Rasamsonia emersonii]|uniref:UPF0261 domain protein n=1 Tax=Rasamsonia emersonii (strain ATCC 16479 / CBS 393.64 / IMI 116815) TaxID=1408163 RepID=A0A0F4YFH0_RASE3|nr:UPF0261 domain protein [Rasamsonia emersonii CBS 393.64]KKA16890.1 UPF0261 domain protein [Rasamsonia emersonii CBS 393.64]